MALRQILLIPDTRLRQIVAPVEEINKEIETLVADMFETMYEAPGIGLAAPQIGVMSRVIVVDCAKRSNDDQEDEEDENAPDPDPDPISMINPEILWFSEEMSIHEEGCLSIPDYYEDIERPASCKVRYLDLKGQTVERELDGLLSTCVQHEIDHLNGKLFIDYLSRLKRERVTKKFQKAAKRAIG
ncbi:Peptide deformylase [hydrothermal vent metagenome]|uniref:Peptide deformylase n=1 Tax=hydrothermal vent metagenome TaxID=652676 RepID=A0A3B0TI41_9ZZZZ